MMVGSAVGDASGRLQVAEEAGAWIDNVVSRIIALLGLSSSSSSSSTTTSTAGTASVTSSSSSTANAKSTLTEQLRPKFLPVMLAVRQWLSEYSRTPSLTAATTQQQQQRQQLFHLVQMLKSSEH